MAAKPLPSPEVLRQLLRYDPETGALFFKERPLDFPGRSLRFWEKWNAKHAGKPALNSLMMNGYLTGRVAGHALLGHRAAWAIYYGEWPNITDHIDGNRTNNRIAI